MAIGSGAEIGVTFGIWKDMSDAERRAWWDYMRREWIDTGNLMAGYATQHYPNREGGSDEYNGSIPTNDERALD